MNVVRDLSGRLHLVLSENVAEGELEQIAIYLNQVMSEGEGTDSLCSRNFYLGLLLEPLLPNENDFKKAIVPLKC